ESIHESILSQSMSLPRLPCRKSRNYPRYPPWFGFPNPVQRQNKLAIRACNSTRCRHVCSWHLSEIRFDCEHFHLSRKADIRKTTISMSTNDPNRTYTFLALLRE